MAETVTSTLDRRLAWGVGLLVGVPIIVAIVHGVASGWVPNGDDGTIATRAYDVFTSDTPLTGVYSQASSVAGLPLHSPGPLLYWLLAIPAHFLPPVTMTVFVGLVNLACVIGSVTLAERVGGVGFMAAAAIALSAMLGSLSAESLHDIWNPSVGLLPVTVLAFLCWSVASGRVKLLPVTVLVASYATQSHLTFVLPSVGMVIVALVFVALHRPSHVGRWLLVSAAVLLVCWSFPLVNEITHRPGNLTKLVDAATGSHGATLGVTAGWHAVVRAIGVPPWWLRDFQQPVERIHDLIAAPGWASVATTILLLGTIVTVAIVGWKRGRRDVAAAQVLSLVLCAALIGVVASGSRGLAVLTNGYVSWWAAPAGMWVWLAAGWGIVTLVRPEGFGVPGGVTTIAASAIAAVIVIVTIESIKAHPDPDHRIYAAVNTIAHRVPPSAEHGTTRVDACLAGPQLLNAAYLRPGLVYAVRRHGAQVVTQIAPQLSGRYRLAGHAYGTYLDVVPADMTLPGTVLARVSASTAISPATMRFKVIARTGTGGPCAG